MSIRRFAFLIPLAASAACSPGPMPAAAHPVESREGTGWEEILRLAAARDYFALRDLVAAGGSRSSPPMRYAAALVHHAFNDPAASNRVIARLLADRTLPDTVRSELLGLRIGNHLRAFEYAAGLAAVDSLLARPAGLDTAELRDARNTRRMLAALAGVPPQTVEVRGPTALRFVDGRVPVTVNDSSRHYVFDTGANISTIMRSEAEALGMRILPAGIEVGTSTTIRVTADLAVADRLAIGGMHYRHVVFLVLDDELLTFPGGFRIPGIVGFPVIERMGEIRLTREGALEVPAEIPARPQGNLALHELTPLTRVVWRGTPLLCRLDTGAGRTQLYEPFHRRARALVDSAATPATRRMGGAGGVRETDVRVLPAVRLGVGDTTFVLDSVDVLPESIVQSEEENYLDCNLGHDVLDAFSRYIINFRDMAFLLR